MAATNPIHIDVRFISATSRELKNEVGKGTFREELYYRLAVCTFVFARHCGERREDLTLFINYFIKKFCKTYKKKISQIDSRVLQLFHNSTWKGNIRELANILERGVLLSENEAITMDCLCLESFGLCNMNADNLDQFLSLKQVVEEAEKKAIVRTLDAANNNRTKAAQLLGISRRALYDKIAAYGLKGIQ